MPRRPTISDLALRAGVSVATVDRVLNGRHPVREETARRVYDAANAIGYHAASLIRQRMQADLPEVALGFILQREDHAFYRTFAREIVRAVECTAGVRARAVVEFAREQTPSEVARLLGSLGDRVDAIALTSLDHHAVTQAVDNLRQAGKPVFSLLSDFAQGVRESYIGLNNLKVGRTAAWLIARTAPRAGKVAIFVGSHRWHGHELRETGFRSFFRQHAPQFEILDALVNLETEQITHEATLSLMDRHRDLVGFYVAGGGMEGALSALREEHRGAALPSVVINELTPESTAALHDHLVTAVIGTPLPQVCRTLVDLMTATVQNGPSGTPGQVFLPLNLHVPESL
jgi:LacI family transcriptional regulator